MVDVSLGDKKINITVSTSGNKASVNATSDTAMYYSNKSREWAISDKIVSNEDYSSKYYANESKQNADKSTVNLGNLTTNYNQYKNELENIKDSSVEEITTLNTSSLAEIETAKTGALTDIDTLHVNSVNDITNLKNTSLSDIETSKTNTITDIVNQETLSVDNVNTAGTTQVNNVNSAGTTQINLAKEQVTLATAQANIATTQAGIATAKTSEVVESGNSALTAITEQETTSKNNIETKGAEQIELIQNEGATQIANVQSTGLNGKADVDLSNMNASQSAKDTIVDWVMPDYSAYLDITSDVSTDQKDRSYPYPVVLYGRQNTGGSANGNDLIIKIGNFQVSAVDYGYGGEPICVFIPANTTFKCYLYTANANRHQVLIVPLKGGNYA